MKFTKNWKRFWTLNRHHAEGFTLVELIVVIAILAILGGVAVPAYSGYIEKTNKQADMTLISEIEHALTLAGYNGTFAEGEGGYIILSVDGVEGIEEGSHLEEALIAAFGTNYADTMKLKYDDWGSNGLLTGIDPERAYAVDNSSYMTGNRVDALLSDVEKMTGMATNLVDVLAAGSGVLSGTTLSGLFSYEDANGNTVCALDETAKKYGVVKGENETWEEWAAKEDNKTAYSNLLVLAAADESEKFMNTMGQDDQYDMSAASDMILEFSSFYAFAATNPEFSTTLDKYMDHLNGDGTVEGLSKVEDSTTGKAWYNAMKAEADKAGYSTYVNDERSFIDQSAFLSIMAGLGNPSEEQASNIAADLGNSNLFTNGVVNVMYNDYLDAVDALSGMYDANYGSYADWDMGLNEGEIAIMVAYGNGATVIMDSLPTA